MTNVMRIFKTKLANKMLAVFVFIIGIICIQLSVFSTAFAANCDKTFLGIPSWSNGLTRNDANCTLQSIGDGGVDTQVYISKLIANIASILSGLFVYICIIYTMYGGYRLITGGSNPDAVKQGRSTIFNGIIGGVIGLGASAIVNEIQGIVSSTRGNNETGFLISILGFTTTLASWVAVLMIILAGINFIMGGSNPENIQKARRRLIYAAIGLIIVVASRSISFILTQNLAPTP